MNKNNIDQALAALADALKSQVDENPLANPMVFINKMPKRSLSGDHINGGKILNFSSTGITDTAKTEQLVIKDDGVDVKNLRVEKISGLVKINGIETNTITANEITVDILTVKDLRADIKLEKNESVIFSGDIIQGKGLFWSGDGYTKQFVYNKKPDRFFSSENIDLAKEKFISVNGVKVIDDQEIGPTVVKSNLREVGKLKGLLVDGSMSVNNYLFFNSSIDRLGLGTESPNAAFSVAEMGIEVMLGTDFKRGGIVGTFASHSLDFVTDNTARISISATGEQITLGNKNTLPVNVSVLGTMSVNISKPDSRVKLDVGGSVKFNGVVHLSGTEAPTSGVYNQGDIVWNSKPEQRKYIGWVCIKSGSPGIWAPFGEIR
jgi:hypothetical protein